MDQVKEYYQQWTEIPQPRKIKSMKLITFVCYFLFLLLLIIYAFGRTGKKTADIVPTILFVDGTLYNLEVIRYLAQRRDVIVGMIVVANNAMAINQLEATMSRVTDLIAALKQEGFAAHVPPVYASYTAADETSFVESLEKYMMTRTVDFLIAGPCTDAAYLLQQYPGLRSNVRTIFVGGGAFNVAGNANYLNLTATAAERNFYMDPSAADYIVARSHGRPVVLLPLDAALVWTDAAYSAIISGLSGATSSAVQVATGLAMYYDSVDTSKHTTVGIMAAAYAADTTVQAGVTVTNIPVRVYTSAADARYGSSYRPSGDSSSTVTVVLQLVKDTFFTHLINVNKLALK